MKAQSCAEYVRTELDLAGWPGWLSYRLLLAAYGDDLEVIDAPIPKAMLSMWGCYGIISLPQHVRGWEREERLWHEIGHYMCNRHGLSGQSPLWAAGRQSERLVRVIDGRDEELAARWVRAFLLPNAQCLPHSADPEYLAAESGCPLPMIYARLGDLAR
jgi:hypothetical protein